MRRLYLPCLLAAAVALLSQGARCDDRADVRQLCAQWRVAVISTQPEKTLALEATGFKSKESDGAVLNGQQLVQRMKARLKEISDQRMVLLVDKFQLARPAPSVSWTFYYSCAIVDREGKYGVKGKKHRLATMGRVRGSLERTAGGWKFKSMEWLNGDTRVDRRPAPGPVMAP